MGWFLHWQLGSNVSTLKSRWECECCTWLPCNCYSDTEVRKDNECTLILYQTYKKLSLTYWTCYCVKWMSEGESFILHKVSAFNPSKKEGKKLRLPTFLIVFNQLYCNFVSSNFIAVSASVPLQRRKKKNTRDKSNLVYWLYFLNLLFSLGLLVRKFHTTERLLLLPLFFVSTLSIVSICAGFTSNHII